MDSPSILHAKDFARRKYKGTYAAVYAIVPGAPLWHEAVATNDALSYLNERGTYEEQRDAYELLYPAYGTYLGGAVGDWVGPPSVAYFSGVVGGHVLGRIKSHRLPRPEPTLQSELVAEDSLHRVDENGDSSDPLLDNSSWPNSLPADYDR